MKHVCNCRACDSVPVLVKDDALVATLGQWYYFYRCECGVRGTSHHRKLKARGAWNADNAEAQNTKALTAAITRPLQFDLDVSVALAESENGGTLEGLQDDIRDALKGGQCERK